jgi:hypothetical protein
MKNQSHKSEPLPHHNRGLIFGYFLFKIIPVLVSCFSIYLGYRLFILGVTGKASLVVHSSKMSGQLLNAAPGLFFALGGIAALIVIVWKGGAINHSSGFPSGAGGGLSGAAGSIIDKLILRIPN